MFPIYRIRYTLLSLFSRLGALCLLAFLAGQPAFALDPAKKITQYGHEVWQREQGLPQNSVWAIAQTPDGYLWFGTEEGLARFDGVAFTVFDKGNTPEIRNNVIYALLVDRQGTLWIGMKGGGLCRRVQGRFETFTAGDGLPDAPIRCLIEDRDGSLWIGTGGGLAHFVNGTFHTYGTRDGLSSDRITALWQDHMGRLWVGTPRGLNTFEAGRFQSTETKELAGEWIAALCEDAGGGLWISSLTGGIWQLKDGKIRRFGPEAGLARLGFHSLAIDRQGNLWIGSRNIGLVRYRDGRFETYTREQGLSDETVLSIFEDREGSLWVGTSAGGLNRLRDTAFVTTWVPEGLSAGLSTAIMEGSDGTMWAGSLGIGGLNQLKEGKVTHLSRKDGLSSDTILSLAEGQDGSVWVGTESGLDQLKGGKVKSYTKKQGLLANAVFSLLTGRDGSLWIGTVQGGLNHLKDGRISSYSKAEGLQPDAVHCLLEGRDGSLWIGTRGCLARLQKGAITTAIAKESLLGDAVLCLFEEGDGSLWIGTEGGGLKRLKGGKLASITTKEGLFHDTVFEILDDGLGNFWMSCYKGVFRANKRQLEEVADGTRRTLHCVSYGIPDGMLSAECNGGFQPAGWKARDSRLWFPTTKGLAVVDPAHLVLNLTPPPVQVETVQIDQKAEDPSQLIRVPAGAKNLEIRYTALSFLVPERVRFKYRLEGFDRDWVEAGTRRTAYYTSLPPGTFRFQVIACNNDGVWNMDGASISFKVVRHYYQTLWFYGLCGLLAVGFGALIQRHFHRVRIHELEMQNRVLDERHRLARDIHDQLSQTLTGIKLQLDTAHIAFKKQPDTCGPFLERAVAMTHGAFDDIRSTLLWLYTATQGEPGLAESLKRLFAPMFEGLPVKLDIEEVGKPTPLSATVEGMLFRVVQEAVTNALRHGQAQQIAINIHHVGKGIQITLFDDGEGFDPSQIHQGFGLAGMRERVEKLGGTLELSSRVGEGTILKVILPDTSKS